MTVLSVGRLPKRQGSLKVSLSYDFNPGGQTILREAADLNFGADCIVIRAHLTKETKAGVVGKDQKTVGLVVAEGTRRLLGDLFELQDLGARSEWSDDYPSLGGKIAA